MSDKPKKTQPDDEQESPAPKKICGIVMPISGDDVCAKEHWRDVRFIIEECIRSANLVPRMVSESPETGILQGNIVQNLYDDEIIVCDLSNRNPNVMFELGLRLAFGKHAVLIKDDKTSVPFDISSIIYDIYPRDLRWNAIEAFKGDLKTRIVETYKAAQSKKKSPFLEHFKKIVPAELGTEQVSIQAYMNQGFRAISAEIAELKRGSQSSPSSDSAKIERLTLGLLEKHINNYEEFCKQYNLNPYTTDVSIGRYISTLDPSHSSFFKMALRRELSKRFDCPF